MFLQTQKGIWQIKDEINNGMYSKIYQTCDNKGNCGYVCKVISNIPDENVQQEINIQMRLKKIAPIVRDYFKRGNKHYIIMDSFDVTIKDLSIRFNTR